MKLACVIKQNNTASVYKNLWNSLFSWLYDMTTMFLLQNYKHFSRYKKYYKSANKIGK